MLFPCAAYADGGASDQSVSSWGDRLYAYGEGNEYPSIRNEIAERFDSPSGWSCSMSAEDGLATLRSVPSEGSRVLGLKIEFLRRSSSFALLSAPKPISVDARCVMLSVRALGRNFQHKLSIVVLDYYGREYVLPLGRLDFTGWKTLRAYVPRPDPATLSGIVQEDRHYARPAGLRIAGLKLDFDPEASYGSFFVYFGDIEATIEGIGLSALPAIEEPKGSAAPVEGSRAAKEEPAPVHAIPDATAPGVDARKADPAKEGPRVLAELSRRIGSALSYPAAARRRGLEGTLVADFAVSERGELAWARVAQSSGSEILDAAGIELLRSVFPVENDSGTTLELRIAIGYRLTGTGN